jgi:hypothetical protein
MTTNKKPQPLRFPPDLIDWLNAYAKATGKSKNAVVQELLESLRAQYPLISTRPGPNPFPAQQVRRGSTPELPVFVCFAPKPFTSE